MKRNLSLLLLLFLPSILTAAPVYNPTTGHWYERVDATASGITWRDAKAAAEARSYSGAQGYLAPITSDQENWWIVNHLGGAAPLDCWLGGYLGSDGKWKWITGDVVIYKLVEW